MTLGTKIIVMKDGVVQQADTPPELPPSGKQICGWFYRSPSMNFMETMVMRKETERFIWRQTEVTLRAKGENEMVLRRAYLGKMVILGLRPEDLQDETTASAHRICYRRESVEGIC